MAGSKHPQIFAERGSVSWGELWEIIGPLAKRVFEGEAIAKRDGEFSALRCYKPGITNYSYRPPVL